MTQGLIAAAFVAAMVILGQWAEKRDLNFFTALIGVGVFALMGLVVLGAFGVKL